MRSFIEKFIQTPSKNRVLLLQGEIGLGKTLLTFGRQLRRQGLEEESESGIDSDNDWFASSSAESAAIRSEQRSTSEQPWEFAGGAMGVVRWPTCHRLFYS